MEFEGNWEMDEDLVAEFLKSQNQHEYATTHSFNSFSGDGINQINNIGNKQHEIDDLFSFLPSFIFEDLRKTECSVSAHAKGVNVSNKHTYYINNSGICQKAE